MSMKQTIEETERLVRIAPGFTRLENFYGSLHEHLPARKRAVLIVLKGELNMTASPETLRDIVIVNHILAHEEVVDAYGHISFRHPDDPEKYLLSRARAPELIEADDIVTYRLDGDAIVPVTGDRTANV